MTAKLSLNAEKLLARIDAGKFYKAYDPNTPKAMQELIDAGLVTITGRPVVIQACYVPAPGRGYQPYQAEKFERDQATLLAFS